MKTWRVFQSPSREISNSQDIDPVPISKGQKVASRMKSW